MLVKVENILGLCDQHLQATYNNVVEMYLKKWEHIKDGLNFLKIKSTGSESESERHSGILVSPLLAVWPQESYLTSFAL